MTGITTFGNTFTFVDAMRRSAVVAGDERGIRFYSDEQLCAFFCVSRDTVRQALAELVQDGLLRRGRGLGTFVSVRKLEERFGPGMDFLQQWESSGTPMQSTLLAFERRAAGDAVGASLGVDAEAGLAAPLDPGLPRMLIFERTEGAPRLVGGCSLNRQPSGAVEMGYWIARSEWNRGLASEACAARTWPAR